MFDVRRSRLTIPRLLVLVMVALIATLPLSHAAAITRNAMITYAQSKTIRFDSVIAPCGFVETVPLTTQYATQGVTFSGPAAGSGGAILNACSNFFVTGYSPPNFLAFNPTVGYRAGGIARGPETITFAAPATTVSLLVAQSLDTVGQATLTAYHGTTRVAQQTRTLSAALTLLAVHAPADALAITRISLSFTSSTLVADNLTWIPVP